MTERIYPIVGSTHDVFPSTSVVRLTPHQMGSARCDFLLDSQKLFEADLPAVPPGKPSAFAGTFDGNDGKRHVLKVTVFPGRGKQVLCGLLFKPGRDRDEGPTGVWVAEEQRPPKPPRRST